MVNNHSDRKYPKDRVVPLNLFQMGFLRLINGGDPITTKPNRDDPPSRACTSLLWGDVFPFSAWRPGGRT